MRRASTILLSLVAVAVPAGAQTPSGDYEVAAVTDGGVLAGQVTFAGAAPAPEELLITRDFEVCGLGYRERREIDVAEGGGLRDVVVFVEGVARGKPWPDAPDGYVLDQKDCYFEPYIQIVPRNSELQILNSDPILHNVHGYELSEGAGPRRTLFNLAQPEKGTVVRPVRPRRSGLVGIECDAHDFMLGWMFAAENPYAVVVDDAGRFTLPDLPPGTYTVGAWHPFLGMQRKDVTVTTGQTTDIGFEFTPE
ncbi:MAG: carboxypeptidase regulatory-like domain-containing protein [Gemmatimonadales bacterium]